jgi:hypothetical protein
MINRLSDQQWEEYQRQGYLRLGVVLDAAQIVALQQRIDAIMLGEIHYPSLQYQLDTGGAYEELPDPDARGAGATLKYRKLQGLEADPLVRDVITRPLFRDICSRHYGAHTSISIFRAMLMNKPASQGTHLPWHQDGGDVWKLDRDPLVTTWIALDPATRQNGCVQVIPGTHRLGLLTTTGSTVRPEDVERHCPEEAIEYLEIEAGECLLLHNWLVHRSDVNRTDTPRRALSACYMDARTVSTLTGNHFPLVFGDEASATRPWAFVEELTAENRRLRESAAEAERYARSLVEHADRLEQMRRETEQYAKSLETELTRLRAALTHTEAS